MKLLSKPGLFHEGMQGAFEINTGTDNAGVFSMANNNEKKA